MDCTRNRHRSYPTNIRRSHRRSKNPQEKEGYPTMKVPQSLRDLMEGAESLVYVEDLSGKKGVMQAINPVAKLVAIVGMIIASLLIINLSYLAAICVVPLVLAAASRIPLKHFFSRTALIPVFAAVISIPILFLI